MGRALLGGLIVAIAAAVIFYLWSAGYHEQHDREQAQIAQLNQQVSRLSDENTRLKAELAKVQSEEANLAAENDEMKKAIASMKATGKIPPAITYPAK